MAIDSTAGAPDVAAQTTPPSSVDNDNTISHRSPVRQATAPNEAPVSKPKPRNLRGLTLPSPVSPSTSNSTVQPHRFQSLGESAANFAISQSSSRPGTPQFARPGTPGTPNIVPRTPLLSRTPLAPIFDLPTTSGPPAPAKSSKLKSLLPRSHNEAHSYFHARIEIQQLASVPFVRGEFGVRWKMKGSVGVGGVKGNEEGREESGGLLGKMKARSHNKGKAREDHHGANEFGMVHAPAMGSSPSLTSEASTNHSNSISSYSSESYTSVGSNSTGKTKIAPSGNLSRNFFSPPTGSPNSGSANGFGLNGYLFSAANSKAYEESLLFSPNQQNTFSSNAALNGPDGPLSPGFMSALSPTGTITPANAGAHALNLTNLSASRGITPYLPLKEHSITFSCPLNAILKFDIARNSNQQGKPKPNLQQNEFKLVVMQRVIPDDPDGVPQNPRLGAVYLNLAEYVGKGKVERRYLLKESRVNATLKLSVELTYVSGNTDYVAPPLPKAEIMGGIEGFLTQNDSLYKQRAKDIYGYTYGPYENKEELEVDLLGRTGADNDGLEDEATVDEDRHLKGLAGGDSWINMHGDPYALPSESESEHDESYSEAARARKEFLRKLSNPISTKSEPQQPPRRQDTMQIRETEKVQRREARREEHRERFRLDLENNPYALPPDSGTESEGDNDTESEAETYESAPENDGPVRQGTIDSDPHRRRGPHHRFKSPTRKTPIRRQQNKVEVASFDIHRLPLAYGPKTTEALIDALFNPVVTTDKERDNPFTLYVDPDDVDAMTNQERQTLFKHYGGRHYSETSPGKEQKVRPYAPPLQMGGRSFSRDTTTSTTTSESGTSGGLDDEATGKLRSPGEATIVGVPRTQAGVGLGIDCILGNSVDRDATIGKRAEKSGGVGAILHQYYKSRKDKIKEGTKKNKGRRRATTDSYADTTSASEDGHLYQQPRVPSGLPIPPTTDILGSPVYVQEPIEMDDGFPTHKRTVTESTMDSGFTGSRTNNPSSGSLSSLSMGSRSGHGHGGAVPSVPPLIPGSVAVAAAAIAAKPESPRNQAPNHPPSRPLTRQGTAASKDLSVPTGRMDRTGLVKGVNQPAIATNGTSGLSNSLNRWWKGLGGQSTTGVNVVSGPGHGPVGNQEVVPAN